ncbi:hypothetical protein [Aspergillus foetidus dsRNA mycovirus]|uniref:Uncharacterized protein n=1 Tax=Aspergillus foetidus dsRNA mycovirus TaxID=1087068 RepID=I7IDT0_9VIRU|nr:hypothetical protein [Aspergillus foetidus dsRNA mycovirus]CCF23068.1 hypothetical protein [Aspergillus foetidus dsRNA mycovirus]
MLGVNVRAGVDIRRPPRPPEPGGHDLTMVIESEFSRAARGFAYTVRFSRGFSDDAWLPKAELREYKQTLAGRDVKVDVCEGGFYLAAGKIMNLIHAFISDWEGGCIGEAQVDVSLPGPSDTPPITFRTQVSTRTVAPLKYSYVFAERLIPEVIAEDDTPAPAALCAACDHEEAIATDLYVAGPVTDTLRVEWFVDVLENAGLGSSFAAIGNFSHEASEVLASYGCRRLPEWLWGEQFDPPPDIPRFILVGDRPREGWLSTNRFLSILASRGYHAAAWAQHLKGLEGEFFFSCPPTGVYGGWLIESAVDERGPLCYGKIECVAGLDPTFSLFCDRSFMGERFPFRIAKEFGLSAVALTQGCTVTVPLDQTVSWLCVLAYAVGAWCVQDVRPMLDLERYSSAVGIAQSLRRIVHPPGRFDIWDDSGAGMAFDNFFQLPPLLTDVLDRRLALLISYTREGAPILWGERWDPPGKRLYHMYDDLREKVSPEELDWEPGIVLERRHLSVLCSARIFRLLAYLVRGYHALRRPLSMRTVQLICWVCSRLDDPLTIVRFLWYPFSGLARHDLDFVLPLVEYAPCWVM